MDYIQILDLVYKLRLVRAMGAKLLQADAQLKGAAEKLTEVANDCALYPAGVNGSVPEAYQNTVKYVTAFHHYIQRVRMGLKWLLERCYDSATDLRSRLNPVYCSMSAPRISTVNEHKHENVFLAND